MNLAQFERDLDAHFDRMYAEHCDQFAEDEAEDDEPDCDDWHRD